jgi:hypothetical protein
LQDPEVRRVLQDLKVQVLPGRSDRRGHKVHRDLRDLKVLHQSVLQDLEVHKERLVPKVTIYLDLKEV